MKKIKPCFALLARAASWLQSPLLLVIRLYWGWQFHTTGWGKLSNIGATTQHFIDWGLPFPRVNVILAGTTECFGGLLLLLGLCSRLVSIPLVFTMVVAYLTADKDALHAFFSDPDKFVSADPFLFMLAAALVLVFGPGCFSLDRVFGFDGRGGMAGKPATKG
jgi:putative oxidoreductase